MSEKLPLKFNFDKKNSIIVILSSLLTGSIVYAVGSRFKHKRQLKHVFTEGYCAGYNKGQSDLIDELS